MAISNIGNMNMSIQNVILDLDETVISGKATDDEIDFEKDKTQLLKFPKFHNMDDMYIIIERPCVQEFLTKLFSNYRVSVWTAASKDYALFIIENVLLKNPPDTPPRHVEYIFWSDHGGLSKKIYNKSPKKLSLLWDIFQLPGFNQYNTIIIDDYVKVVSAQPGNAIKILEFDCLKDGHEKDAELLTMIDTLEDKFKILEKQSREDQPKELNGSNEELLAVERRVRKSNLFENDEDEEGHDADEDNDNDNDETKFNISNLPPTIKLSEDNASLTSEEIVNETFSNTDEPIETTIETTIEEASAPEVEVIEPDKSVEPKVTEQHSQQSTKEVEDGRSRSSSEPQILSSEEPAIPKPFPILVKRKAQVQLDEESESGESDSENLPTTEEIKKPLDLSNINVNVEKAKNAEKDANETISKLNFVESTSEESVPKPTNLVDSAPKIEYHDSPTVATGARTETPAVASSKLKLESETNVSNEQQLSDLQTKVKEHKFNKEDDDDDGENKVCTKCSENFITYSGKDLCPECRT